MRSTILRASVAASILALAGGAAFAQAPKSNAEQGSVQQQLRSTEQQMLQAGIQGDKDAFGKVLADDVTWVMRDGRVLNKDQALATLPAPVRSVDVQEVLLLGETATMVTLVHMKDGTERRALQEWVNRDGQWKLLAHQSAQIGAEGTPATSSPTGTTGAASPSEARTVAPTLNSDEERAVWQAQTDIVDAYGKGDTSRYSNLTADPFTRIETNGQLYNRRQWIDHVAKNRAHPLKHGAISDVEITIDKDNQLARVTLQIVPSNPDGTQGPPERQTRIFALRAGRWQQVAAVSTPLAAQ